MTSRSWYYDFPCVVPVLNKCIIVPLKYVSGAQVIQGSPDRIRKGIEIVRSQSSVL